MSKRADDRAGQGTDARPGADIGLNGSPSGHDAELGAELGALVDALRQANAALTERARRKSEFLADVSHEFRTPLTLMLGPLATIIDTHSDDLGPHLTFELRRIQRNGERLYRLVNEMLDFTKLEAGAMRPRLRLVDVVALIQSVVDDARWQADDKRISLTTDHDSRLPPQRVDARMIEKCVVNLISNALRFAPPHGRVSVATIATADDFAIVVEDTGPGIPADQQAYVFQRFRQAEVVETAGRACHGTGLGLALVKQFAELHGGRVELYSEPGQGARFTVRLPRCDGAERTDEWQPARVAQGTDSARNVPTPMPSEDSERVPGWRSLVPRFERVPVASPTSARAADDLDQRGNDSRPRILVADDDRDVRSLIREILMPHFEVVEAEDGAQAWQSICARQPDVAVLDVMMPGLDGIELVRRIKAEPLLRMIPCLLITADASRHASVSALDSGADDFLAKPFFADELSARVRAAARMRRMYSELHESRARLSSLETQHRAVIDNASDGIMVFERGGRIRTWNRSMRQIFGYRENEVIGANIDILSAVTARADRVGERLESEVAGASDRWLRLAEFHSCEWHLRHKDGRLIAVESSRSEIAINMEPLFVEVVRDIRDRKRAEERLAEANRQLRSMSRVAGKAELATGVLHNVSNVLQVVKVNVARLDELVVGTRIKRLAQAVAMLGEQGDDLVGFLTEDNKGKLLPRYLDKLVGMLGRNLDSARQAIDDASLGIEQIETIVRAQQENARTVLVKTPVVLGALIGDVLRLLDVRGPVPRVVHKSGSDVALVLDRHRIVDILINVLDNAFDATAHLPVDEQVVTLHTEVTDRCLRIEVTDNGVGMDEDGPTRIFAHGFTSKPGGRGFGLHVSALSAREMDGSLQAHSDGPGRGARFVLEVPIAG